jgi:hypothetical protein
LNGYVAELREMRLMAPTELQATIAAVDRNIRSAAPDTPPDTIAQAVKRKERMETLLGNMRTGLKEDAITWGDRSGLVPMTRIDLQKPDGMTARIAAAHTIAERYGQPVQFFTKIEREQLGAILKHGGKPMLNVLGSMAKQLGPDMITAMSEVSKHAPEAATVGWMMSAGLPIKTIEDAALGMERQAKRALGEKTVAPPAVKDERTAFVDTFGTAFARMPLSEGAVTETAKAIYEVRAQRMGLKDPDPKMFASILKEVVGETTDGSGNAFGGVHYQSGGIFSGTRNPIIVPPNMRQNGVREALDAIYSIDEVADTRRTLQTVRDDQGRWAGARSPRLEEDNPREGRTSSALSEPVLADAPDTYVMKSQPVDGKGRPLSIGALRRATLVSVGDGRYLMAMGDPQSDDPQYVQNVDGRNFVLDMNKLEPLIRKRRPDIYKGYVNPDYAMPTNLSAVAP